MTLNLDALSWAPEELTSPKYYPVAIMEEDRQMLSAFSSTV